MKILLFLFILLSSCNSLPQEKADLPPFSPEQYVCYRTDKALNIDGKGDELAWKNAPWTNHFVDIEGDKKPKPAHQTRAKMLWDDTYFYFYAYMEEPHVWAKLKKRDSVIFYDNDFEVFIDPDGDTHQYYELEMNAFNTIWDLFLDKPYRDHCRPLFFWDIGGLKSGVFVEGTLNDPSDKDKGWSVEIAIPWAVLKECAPKKLPEPGDQWRVGFSRVEWKVEVKDGEYVKTVNPKTNKPFPENNWVWSPQGVIAMHQPETWGFVQFSGKTSGAGEDPFVWNPDEDIKWALRQVYYLQKAFFEKHKRYAENARELGLPNYDVKGVDWPPQIQVTDSLFEAKLFGNKVWTIISDGRVWGQEK